MSPYGMLLLSSASPPELVLDLCRMLLNIMAARCWLAGVQALSLSGTLCYLAQRHTVLCLTWSKLHSSCWLPCQFSVWTPSRSLPRTCVGLLNILFTRLVTLLTSTSSEPAQQSLRRNFRPALVNGVYHEVKAADTCCLPALVQCQPRSLEIRPSSGRQVLRCMTARHTQSSSKQRVLIEIPRRIASKCAIYACSAAYCVHEAITRKSLLVSNHPLSLTSQRVRLTYEESKHGVYA